MAVLGTTVEVGRQGDGPAQVIDGLTHEVGRPSAVPVTGGVGPADKAPSENVARGDLPKVGGNVAN